MSKVVQVYWFSSMQQTIIGIVKCKDEITGEIKYYIGNGKGYSAEDDVEEIKSWGAKISKQQLEDMLDEKEY